MIQQLQSAGIEGIDAVLVLIEVATERGLPRIAIVGLPDRSVRESIDRIRTALTCYGIRLPPDRRLTINLAPAWRRKEGAGFDLPIAIGIAASVLDARWPCLRKTCLVGELALDGAVRPVGGILPMLIEARRRGVAQAIVAAENACEAYAIEGLRIHAASGLGEVIEHLSGAAQLPLADPGEPSEATRRSAPDFGLVRGQELAKRALVLAGVGGHNVLFQGPPGTGKTMLSRCLPGILPPLSDEEALEVTAIHSVAGLHPAGEPLLRERPWRAPHHTISEPALVGGGLNPRPGEVSLAHRGVLFLDELPELDRRCRESLREPLEGGQILISRGMRSVCFPADFLLVAAMNLCPCGVAGQGDCRCSVQRVQRYRRRISGPLLDRIDIQVRLQPVPFEILHDGCGVSATTQQLRILTESAHAFARARRERDIVENDRSAGDEIRGAVRLDPGSRRMLRDVMRERSLSARSHDGILRVARTVADLEDSEEVKEVHLAEAIGYRVLEVGSW